MKKEIIEIESSPTKKRFNWIILIVLLLIAIAYLGYNYFIKPIEPNQTNISDTTPVVPPDINDTLKPRTSVCGNGKCEAKENYTNCPKDCQRPSEESKTCTPNCAEKQCGSDGCGGICGTCNAGYECNPTFSCSLIPLTDNTNINDGLVGYWKLDEGQGNVIMDSTSLNGQGSLIGGVYWTEGKKEKSLSFDGATGYAKIPSTTAIANLTEFTFSVWTKINNLSSEQEILQRGSAYKTRGAISLYYSQSSRKFIFGFYDNNIHIHYAFSPIVLARDTWQHVTVVSDGHSVIVYLNGVPGQPINVNGMCPLLDGNSEEYYYKGMYLGALLDKTSDPVNFLKGAVDEVRVYNRTLSLSEIYELYGSLPASYEYPTSLATTPWPKLYGKVGPYAFTNEQDVKDMANAGFNLAYGGGYFSPSSSIGKALRENNISQIVGVIHKLYEICRAKEEPCVLSEEEEKEITDYAKNLIDSSSQDPNVVGYWILDDSPGDVHEAIQKFHDLIAESNKESIFPRPAICGFGGGLDYKKELNATYYTSGWFEEEMLVNYNPESCDILALYLYGTSPFDDPATVDWSMGHILPQAIETLRSRGWNQSKEPLMALPHTFSMPTGPWFYPLPNATDVAIQCESYCKSGAIALLPYAWHTSSSGSVNALWNTPQLVGGLQQGMEICRDKYWSA